jgi:acyl-CoA thioester hydrolase
MTARFGVRVYYEDTDLGGVVYHANFLKFTERARSEWLRAIGVDQMALKQTQGLVFVVRRIEADYLRPARFDDLLTVETETLTHSGARLVLRQDVLRAAEPLFTSRVTLACLGPTGAAARLPDTLRALL